MVTAAAAVRGVLDVKMEERYEHKLFLEKSPAPSTPPQLLLPNSLWSARHTLALGREFESKSVRKREKKRTSISLTCRTEGSRAVCITFRGFSTLSHCVQRYVVTYQQDFHPPQHTIVFHRFTVGCNVQMRPVFHGHARN